MGLRGPIFDPAARGRTPAVTFIAGLVQRLALPRPHRLPVALPAVRLATLGRRLPAVDALA